MNRCLVVCMLQCSSNKVPICVSTTVMILSAVIGIRPMGCCLLMCSIFDEAGVLVIEMDGMA